MYLKAIVIGATIIRHQFGGVIEGRRGEMGGWQGGESQLSVLLSMFGQDWRHAASCYGSSICTR